MLARITGSTLYWLQSASDGVAASLPLSLRLGNAFGWKNLRLNRSSNVDLIPCAAGEDPGEAELYVVERFNDVCNSLRPPDTPELSKAIRVEVRRLDDILSEMSISKVDFIKLDAEGAELSVLYGAMKLLSCNTRPAMLVEVQDIRKTWSHYPSSAPNNF